jgi:hypothetical protein
LRALLLPLAWLTAGSLTAQTAAPADTHGQLDPLGGAARAPAPAVVGPGAAALTCRWLFVWRDLSQAAEVDRVIARLPAAAAAGYNGLVLPARVAPVRAAALRQATQQHGMELILAVMGGVSDRNYVEGVPVVDAPFVVGDTAATLVVQGLPQVRNGGFEAAQGDRLAGWTLQDDVGLTTFADHQVVHSGGTSLRMQNVGQNAYRHCRVAQPLHLIPHRQYRLSVWLRSQDLRPADPEVKVLTADSQRAIGYQTFHTDATQDWTRCDLVFNSMEHERAMLYLGSWGGDQGTFWWDDLTLEEIGLVNVLRRPGCPVTVRDEAGQIVPEGVDYAPVRDPLLHPWRPWHEAPGIHLVPGSRLRTGQRLRVSYYHPLVVYEDRVTFCLSEPQVLADWRREVVAADSLLHPDGFLMSHDELRVVNQCAACRQRGLTPGQLLAWNVQQAARIIRQVRPEAQIWVWSDMFDPQHNARDDYYLVNGSLRGSWEGLDPGIGIVNWHGGLAGRNCAFFADRGLRQILSGYYDSDEDGSAIAAWLANTAGVPGIVGAMYTTWEDRYEAMVPWAARAWGAARR